MALIILMFSFVYFSVAMIFEINMLLKTKNLTISSIISFLFIFIYGIFPFLVIFMWKFADISISTSFATYDYSTDGLMNTFFVQYFGVVAYLIFKYITRRNVSIIEPRSTDLELVALQFTTVICMGIGILSMYLWCRAYGGIFNLIDVANAVRGGWSSVENSFAFFKRPARIVLISSFSSLILIKNSYKKHFNRIIFVISFVCSILFLFASDGRLSFATYLLVLLFIQFDIFAKNRFSSKKMKQLMIIGVVCFVLIINLDTITRFIRQGTYIDNGSESLLYFVLSEFAYTIISGQTAFEHAATGNLLIFDEIINGVLAWIPSSLKPFQAINIWDYNTELSTRNFSGQYPCDFISTSLYSLSYLGPIIFSVFWGNVVKQIEKLKTGGSIFQMVCYYSLMLTCIRLVNYCMLYSFILSIFAIVVYAIVYIAIKKIIVLRWRRNGISDGC